MTFSIKGFKVMVMAGFELHFDPFWQFVTQKKIDLVLLPTASTFGSHNRWREIIKSKAFLHGCFILRANRLGEYSDDEVKWKFYGDTMLVNPEGEVEMMLEDKESMLIEVIEKKEVLEHRKAWGFEKELMIREKSRIMTPEAYFNRQIQLWGEATQKSLQHKKIAIIGSGGLGCTLAMALGTSGIGEIHMVDFDTVSQP